MTMYYAARHSAKRTSPSVTHRAGASVLAATALGLGVTTMTATSASANGGPETPTAQTAPTGGAQTAPTGGAQSAPTGGAQSVTASTGSTTFSDVVDRGDSGSAVEQIQEKVGVSADGQFGEQTYYAVKAWQRDNGLTDDGVVGPETGSAMGITGGSTSGSASSGSVSSGSASSGSDSSDSAPSTGGTSYGASSSEGGSTAGIVGSAEGLIGSPYVMGGTSTSGFDCSGFVQHVYGQNGKDIPRTTQQQMAAATPVSEPQPGDIVFFGDDAYHNGIYAGNGKIIDAGNPGTGVTERDIWTDDVSYGRF